MRKLHFFIILPLLIKCGFHDRDNNKKMHGNDNAIQESKEFGVYSINLYELYNSTQDTLIFKINGNHIKLNSTTLSFGDEEYDLMEEPNSTWEKIIKPKVFDPEAGVFYIEGFRINSTTELYFEQKKVDFLGSKKYIRFYKYEEFLKDRLLGFPINNPLRVYPNVDSPVVDSHFTQYYYEVKEYEGDWVMLETESEASGVSVSGWCLWKIEDNPLPNVPIEIIYCL
ncbi:MAG: hypothetical protein WD077_03140 [Bacteroidia bacterium]